MPGVAGDKSVGAACEGHLQERNIVWIGEMEIVGMRLDPFASGYESGEKTISS